MKKKKKKMSTKGCYTLFGHIVKEALEDYRMPERKKKEGVEVLAVDEHRFTSAERFLFSNWDWSLENWIKMFGIPLNLRMIRRVARGETKWEEGTYVCNT